MTKNTFTKKILILALLVGMTWVVNAQSKVGKNVINLNPNAVFEMEHNSKGMLLPRLALSSTTAFTPLSAHVGGMVVYNTATAADVTPGFYYDDGTKWVRIAGSASSTGSGNLTNDNGIIVSGGTGATLINASLRLDSSAIAKMIGQSPVKDSIIKSIATNLSSAPLKDSLASTVSTVIQAGNVIGQNLTAGTLLQTTGTPTGASLKTAGYQVDTTAMKSFIATNLGKSPIKDSVSSTVSTVIQSGTVTGQNTIAGSLITVTNGSGASLKAMTVAADTNALKTFISNTATSGALTGQNLTAGSLLQTTGTPTGASLKAAGYQVDTTALKSFVSTTINNGGITGKNTTAGSLVTVTNGVGASLTAMTVAVDTTAMKSFVAVNVNSSPIKDSLTTVINNQISGGSITGKDLTNSNGIIVTGGTGTTLKATSLRLDSTAVAKMVSQSPTKDSVASVVNNVINSGTGITGKTTTAGSLVTVINGSGAALKDNTIAVDTTALKSFVSSTINNGGITGKNTTAGSLVTVTNGAGASLTAMTVAVDTTAMKSFVAVNVNKSPIKDSLTTVINNQITGGSISGQNLTAGTLLQTTGTPTGASLKTAGYQVDTTAMKSFIATNLGKSPIKDSVSSTVSTVIQSGTVTGQNTTAGSLITVTNGSGASLKAMTVAADTNALKTFIGRVAPLTADSTSASNGLTMTGRDVRLGGALTAATTITTTSTNTLALAGLQSGANTDSILVVNPTTNIVSRISAGRFKNSNLLVTTAASLTVADTVDIVIFRGTVPSTITLPAAASNIGRVVRILNYAASATNVDITLSPAPVIQGGTTNDTNPTISSQLSSFGSNAASALGNSIELVSDGTNWYKLGN